MAVSAWERKQGGVCVLVGGGDITFEQRHEGGGVSLQISGGVFQGDALGRDWACCVCGTARGRGALAQHGKMRGKRRSERKWDRLANGRHCPSDSHAYGLSLSRLGASRRQALFPTVSCCDRLRKYLMQGRTEPSALTSLSAMTRKVLDPNQLGPVWVLC